jgi:hypothetical protein
MKKLGLALALTLMGATAASALELRIGDDRGWDRGRDRVIVRERDRDWDRPRLIRRHRDVVTTGSVDCHTTVVYRRNDRGVRVKRTIRECD